MTLPTLVGKLAASLLVASSLLLAVGRCNGDANIIMDKLDNCDELVKEKKCITSPEQMKKDCPISCREWQNQRMKTDFARISDDQPSFFDLSAKNATGSTLDFDMFDGYLTIVSNVLKDCLPGRIDAAIADMEHLHDVWPFALEVLVFPFSTPEQKEMNQAFEMTIGCDSFKEAVEKKGRRIHVMDEVEINGKNAHPVYKYLIQQFERSLKDEDGLLPTDLATFFIITPDGDRIEMHIGGTLERIKKSVAEHMKQDL